LILRPEQQAAMSALTKTLDDIRKKIYSEMNPTLKKYAEIWEDKTKVNVEYAVLGVGIILAIMVFANVGAHFISMIVGFLYPAYATLGYLEGVKFGKEDAWLMYWVLLGSILMLESLLFWLIPTIPLYYPIKITFLLWCMLPQYNGSLIVYTHAVKAFVTRNESPIDSALRDAKGTIPKSE